jgi:hypothetical protein
MMGSNGKIVMAMFIMELILILIKINLPMVRLIILHHQHQEGAVPVHPVEPRRKKFLLAAHSMPLVLLSIHIRAARLSGNILLMTLIM